MSRKKKKQAVKELSPKAFDLAYRAMVSHILGGDNRYILTKALKDLSEAAKYIESELKALK